MHIEPKQFTNTLKDWRKVRKMSQLDLALAAEVSQRHVSWLETGRSRPSRDMVVRLTDALEVPLRDRNHLLNAAGYADMYTAKALDEPTMAPVTAILEDMLLHHEPYPAFVLDRRWNIVMKNTAADTMLEVLGDPQQVWRDIGDDGRHNIALLTVHPQGLRQYISNWDEIVGGFVRRLKKEAFDSADQALMEFYETLTSFVGELPHEQVFQDLLPVLPIEIDLGGFKLKLASVISTFGTAQDITANELRVETFYPADEQTKKFFTE
jgi:transcriptional regulator with XRE-family HTH domain